MSNSCDVEPQTVNIEITDKYSNHQQTILCNKIVTVKNLSEILNFYLKDNKKIICIYKNRLLSLSNIIYFNSNNVRFKKYI